MRWAWEDGEDEEAEDREEARLLLGGILRPGDHTCPSGALRGPRQGQRDHKVLREKKQEGGLGGHRVPARAVPWESPNPCSFPVTGKVLAV